MEDYQNIIFLNPGPSTSVSNLEERNEYVTWTTNETKMLIDLYQKYNSKVGTLQIRNMKKLWEIISAEINKLLKINVTAHNCENKWRVLDRAYKKYIANQKKTGRGKKYFEFAEEMDRIYHKKRNIHPEILLSTETIADIDIPTTNTDCENRDHINLQKDDSAIDEVLEKQQNPKRSIKNSVLNRNKILEKMRLDRLDYQKERLKLEEKKLELKQKQIEALERRNKLIEERNFILKANNTN